MASQDIPQSVSKAEDKPPPGSHSLVQRAAIAVIGAACIWRGFKGMRWLAKRQGGTHISFTSFGGPTLGGSFRSTSTSTKIVNGKRVVTKKVVENGQETVMIEEDGVLRTKSVNGVPQSLDGPTSNPSLRA